MPTGPEYQFTTADISTLATGTDLTTSEMTDVIDQANPAAVSKNRRKALLKLLALLQNTA